MKTVPEMKVMISHFPNKLCSVYPLEEEDDDKNDCDYATGNITKPLKKKKKFHYLTVVDEASDPLPFKYHHIRNGTHDS